MLKRLLQLRLAVSKILSHPIEKGVRLHLCLNPNKRLFDLHAQQPDTSDQFRDHQTENQARNQAHGEDCQQDTQGAPQFTTLTPQQLPLIKTNQQIEYVRNGTAQQQRLGCRQGCSQQSGEAAPILRHQKNHSGHQCKTDDPFSVNAHLFISRFQAN